MAVGYTTLMYGKWHLDHPAEQLFLRSLDLASQQKLLSREVRTKISLARSRRGTGRLFEARASLGAVYGRFGEGLNLQICGRRKRSSTNSREPTDQNVLGDQIVGGIKSLLNGTGDGYSSKWPPCVGQL